MVRVQTTYTRGGPPSGSSPSRRSPPSVGLVLMFPLNQLMMNRQSAQPSSFEWRTTPHRAADVGVLQVAHSFLEIRFAELRLWRVNRPESPLPLALEMLQDRVAGVEQSRSEVRSFVVEQLGRGRLVVLDALQEPQEEPRLCQLAACSRHGAHTAPTPAAIPAAADSRLRRVAMTELFCALQNLTDAGLGPVCVLELRKRGEVPTIMRNPLARFVQVPARRAQRWIESQLFAVHEELRKPNKSPEAHGIPVGFLDRAPCSPLVVVRLLQWR